LEPGKLRFVPGEHRVGDEEVDRSQGNGGQHHGEAIDEELDEGDLIAILMGDCCGDHIGRGPNQSAIAPETGAVGKGPYEGCMGHTDRIVVVQLYGQPEHHRCHRDIADEGRQEGGQPEDHQNAHRGLVLLLHAHDHTDRMLTQPVDETQLGHRLGEHQKVSKQKITNIQIL